MIVRIRAIRALRWNYRWRGVWAWLTSRQNRWQSAGRVTVDSRSRSPYGYRRLLSEPQSVIAEQTALAEGVFA